MPVVPEITVDYYLARRIVRVGGAVTQINIQDLHDSVRDIEDEPDSMQYAALAKTSGKEALGGSVFVGLSMTLQNAVLAFDARKASIAQGTVTSTDATGVTLTDSGATFVTDLVKPGAWVVNLTDGSICSVLSVLSETQLLTDRLGDGSDNQFTSGDVYKVWPVIQCEVNGGNLVAVDENESPIDAILPTAGTQVVRTSSSSATLQGQADIEYASFNGGVTVDLLGPNAGTTFPTGTPRQPVNNLADALTIANSRGFQAFYILGDATIDSGLDYTGKTFYGESQAKSVLTITSAAIVNGCEFYDAEVTGTLDGGGHLKGCLVDTLNYVDGYIEQCVLQGTIKLGGDAHLLDCWSGIPGAGTPVIDFDGSASTLALRNFNGGITLRNKTGAEPVSVDLNSGQIVLESTVSAGAIILRGVGKLTDNSTGTATVDAEYLLGPTSIASAVWASVVDGTITAEQSLQLMNAILGGKRSGVGTTTEKFRDLADTKDRVTATLDAQANRVNVVLDSD